MALDKILKMYGILCLLFNIHVVLSFYFEPGYDHYYTYSAESNLLDLHNITTIMKVRIRHTNTTRDEMTMYQLFLDSFVQHTDNGFLKENPMNWNLAKPFLFGMTSDGLVSIVHYSPEDNYEVVCLKKVVTSVISAKRKVHGSNTKYANYETDHSGHLEHTYKTERTPDGVKLTREHQSNNTAERSHNKTLHYNRMGTITQVYTADKVTMRSKPEKVTNRNEITGEDAIKDTSSGEFPSPTTVSMSQMKLQGKKRIMSSPVPGELTKGSLLITPKPTETTRLTNENNKIKRLLLCIGSHSDKYAVNRTECVVELRDILKSLNTTEFRRLAEEELRIVCQSNDTLCTNRRNLFIDMTSQRSDNVSQELIISHILLNDDVKDEDKHRFLFHCPAIKNPSYNLIEAVKELCFGEDEKLLGTKELSTTQRRSCLALGSLMKNYKSLNSSFADQLSSKVENWLNFHNESNSAAILNLRKKRHVTEFDAEKHHHIVTKMVLIQVLGNAGMERARDHIISYMQPGKGALAWRRSAVRGLRHFSCNKSAEALLVSAVNDDSHIVRKMALEAFQTHPKGNENPRELQNIILQRNYTYHVLMRLKRGITFTFDEGVLHFLLEVPGVNWKKVIGSSDIGASVGLEMRNTLELELGPLSGYFEIDVYDSAFAEVHVGFAGIHVDIFRALACYRGHIGYDFNILKDFGINTLNDLVHAFDRIFKTIVDPIKAAVQSFKKIIEFFKNGGIAAIIKKIVETVKNLPVILENLAQKVLSMVADMVDLNGLPWLEDAKKLVTRIKTVVEDVKDSIMEFYNSISDAVTVTLPYIGKTIVDSVKLLFTSLKDIFKNPAQAFKGFGRAIIQIRMAVSMFVDTKNQLIDKLSFTSGKVPFWMSIGDDILGLFDQLKVILEKVQNSITDTNSLTKISDGLMEKVEKVNDLKNGLSRTITKCVPNLTISGFIGDVHLVSHGKVFNEALTCSLPQVTRRPLALQHKQYCKLDCKDILRELENIIKETLAPLFDITEIAKPFLDAFKSVTDIIQSVKSAYEQIKSVINKGKALVQKIFGPKFDIKFPNRRKREKAPCGKGVYPTTSGDTFQTTGVDLLATKGKPIVCPVNGMVHKKGNNKILIKPSDDDFNQFEIVLQNLQPNSSIQSDGIFVNAGTVIGKATTSKCSPNFIHLALRKTATTELADSEYEYIDPSQYLDRLLPQPKWVQECNDFTFEHLWQTVDSDALDKKGAKEKEEAASRSNKDVEKELTEMEFMKESNTYRPEGWSPGSNKSIGDQFSEGLKNALSGFGDIAKLFKSTKIPNILDLFDINAMSLSKVKQILQSSGSKDLVTQFDTIILRLKEVMDDAPTVNPQELSIMKLRALFTAKGITGKLGTKTAMVSRLLSMLTTLCPNFINSFAKGFGHICTPDSDCLGLTCGITLPVGLTDKKLKVHFRIDECNGLLYITTSKTVAVTLNGIEETIPIDFGGVCSASPKVKLIAKGDKVDDQITVSASFLVCADEFQSCFPAIDILKDVTFNVKSDCLDDVAEQDETQSLYDIRFDVFLNLLSEFNLLNNNLLRMFNSIRDAVVDKIFNEPQIILKIAAQEFLPAIDACVDVKKAFPPIDIDFLPYVPPIFFMVGPIPMSFSYGAGGAIGLDLELGICFISMKAEIGLTPWVGGKVWGALAIDIGFARAGLKLVGYLLQTKFKPAAIVQFNKFPLKVGAKMDMVLIPLTLELRAFAELRIWLLFKTITIRIVDVAIWRYSTPAINRNVFTIPAEDDDTSPPEFMPSSVNRRKKREGPRGCIVKQIIGRNPSDPAFILEVSSEDEVSDVVLNYAIGTQEGGTNVQDWTEMGGKSLVVPADLPNGIALHWTIRAKNSQGLFAYTHCMLHTFDNSLPDGRVDPSYIYSSHPHTLTGTVFVFDDSPLTDENLKALGYSSGQANEVIPWVSFALASTTHRPHITDELKYFTVSKPGKLTTAPFTTVTVMTDVECARECLKYKIKCIAFDFEYHTETCDLQEYVEGPSAELRISGTYKTYERLGVGHTSYVEYDNVEIQHGLKYHINAKIKNTLNYTSYLHSYGILVDFIPPYPGPLGDTYFEEIRRDKCSASVLQRCVEPTWLENHRYVIDGNTSRTLFNGLQPLIDQEYTLVNHYASVNFDGFHDNETGIWAYAWAFGSDVCGTDIVDFRDPHAHMTHPRYWSHTGYAKHLRLNDGPHYTIVQSLNNVIFGGSLVCTVCHSNPVIVDRSPPTHVKVTDIIYDEDFDILGVYYNTSDPHSGIYSVDFGLGKTKHDIKLRGYSLHLPINRDNPYLVIEDLGLPPGVPAWIRVRAVNHVKFFTTGHYDEPILIDHTAPIKGYVIDGDVPGKDMMYQSDNTKICAQWQNFYDPESGIHQFQWAVGTLNETDNIVPFRNISHHMRDSCVMVQLEHNVTYYSTIITYNDALNMKEVNNTSDGVLIDITPPIAGVVVDGVEPGKDIEYSSHSASKSCNWDNFTDPESKIAKYEIALYINNELKKQFPIDNGQSKSFTDHSVSLKHQDQVYFTVTAINGAELTVDIQTNGYLVDHTTPILRHIQDTETGDKYQTNDNELILAWEFEDPESGIKEYRYFVTEFHHGSRNRIWPVHSNYESMEPQSDMKSDVRLDNMKLTNGAEYTVHVTAVNNALLSTSHESDGVIIDITPPIVSEVHIGLPKEDEELDDDNNVLHVDINGITASWNGFDPESGITNFYVCIGTTTGDCSVTSGYNDVDTKLTAYIDGVLLQTYEFSGILYYINVKARNGAGVFSDVLTSNPVKVLKANVPGYIYDGPTEHNDAEYTTDRSSMSMSFQGFESESCNIVYYEWSIGSEPYFSDIMPYTDYGIIETGDGKGKASVHIELDENKDYYLSVRARTGQKCHEEYIVSTSNGIKLDTTSPTVQYIGPKVNDSETVTKDSVIYQQYADSLEMEWILSEPSTNVSWGIGSHPGASDFYQLRASAENKLPPLPISLAPGNAYFVTLHLEDQIGHVAKVSSPPVIADITPPNVHNFTCTDVISHVRSLIKCRWSFMEELESQIKYMKLEVGPLHDPSNNITILPLFANGWEFDVKDVLKDYEDDSLEITIHVENILGQQQSFTTKTLVDKTPPKCKTIEVITRTDDKNYKVKQICQLPQTYLEIGIQNMMDEESDIDRLEVALGSTPDITDILKFKPVEVSDRIFLDGLSLPIGSAVHAIVRIYNSVGLYSVYRSEAVIVSPLPRLIVYDGSGNEDADYQSELNIITGSWHYTDPCPIFKAEWKIEDITGKTIQNFTQIVGNSGSLYNDELELRNGVKYVVFVRIVDALNRTDIAKSDGITILIQRPSPGYVRDGLGAEDINYQLPIDTLSANWDSFGDENAKNPTQHIVRYEIAIGSDRRFQKTKSNIHYFVDVGLKTSYTFYNLNLAPKTAKYYLTVRAYSKAGAYTEQTTNGIRVGFKDGIGQGEISLKSFQSSTSKIDVSWSGFESDLGIDHYMVGVSSFEPDVHNDTFDCSWLETNLIDTDVFPLDSVNLDTFSEIRNLSLQHGKQYFVLVVAADIANLCSLKVSNPVTIDRTAPAIDNADVLLNRNNGGEFIYLESRSILNIDWTGASDPESNISYCAVNLYQINSCPNVSTTVIDNEDVQENHIVRTITVFDDSKITFYDLNLIPDMFHAVRVTVVNNAGLETFAFSPFFKIDELPPLPGSVKIGPSWYEENIFQSSTTSITAWTAIANTEESFRCESQRQVLPVTDENSTLSWQQINGKYFDSVNLQSNDIKLFIGYNTELSNVLKSGIITQAFALLEGNYTIVLKAASGRNSISAIAFATSASVFISKFEIPNTPSFDNSDFLHMNDTVFSNETSGANENSTTNNTSNFANEDVSSCCGFGLSIIGHKESNSDKFGMLFWAIDAYKESKVWAYTTGDPTDASNIYTLSITKDATSPITKWNLNLFLNGERKSEITGLQFDVNMHLSIRTWNKDDYKEPLLDPFNPFRTEAVVKQVLFPIKEDKPCLYGKGFYDAESKISEMWVGVSDSVENIDNILPMLQYKEFCIPCQDQCKVGCNSSCDGTDSSFNMIQINLNDLDLTPTLYKGENETITDMENTTTYYVNVKIVDLAGHEVTMQSNGIMVDPTPPKCDYMRCVDPLNSMDQPVNYIGSNNTVGAYWSCTEDISEIKNYQYSVGTSPGADDIITWTNLGIKSKHKIVLDNNTNFIHLETYYVNVKILNTAGQSDNYSCNVTADFLPPDVTGTITQTLFQATHIAPKDIRFSRSMDRVGISWQSNNDEAQFYEWKIGTYINGEDIFPRVKVGMYRSGTTEIVQGHMRLDGSNLNISISGYKQRNTSQENITDFINSDTLFRIEPGRCLYQTLYAVSRSHLSSTIDVPPVCYTRSKDLFIDFDNTTDIYFEMEDQDHGFSISENKQFSNRSMQVNIKAASGSVSVGSLSSEDLDATYGSSASISYKPYIKNPDYSMEQTSRIMKNRLVSYLGKSFFIAPVEATTIENVQVKLFIPRDELDDWSGPALARWDTETEKWIHVEEGCVGEWSTIERDGYYTVEVCVQNLNTQSRRRKRRYNNRQTTVTDPMQLSVFKMNTSTSNTAPVILTDTLVAVEENIMVEQIEWEDKEGDNVEFEIYYPEVGNANMTKDGTLTFEPPTDFSGHVYLTVIITEIDLPYQITPQQTQKTIMINVENVNDPPILGFVLPNNTLVDINVAASIDLISDGNVTVHTLGTIIVADVDKFETLTILHESSSQNAQINLNDVEVTSTTGISFSGRINTLNSFLVNITSPVDFHGSAQLRFLGHDEQSDGTKLYTPRLDINLYILWSPCVYGNCTARNQDLSCDNVIRAETFEPYNCTCLTGYTGTWCETELDECLQNSCSLLHDCVDKIGFYSCDINIGKLLAVIFSILVALGVMTVVLIKARHIKQQRSKIGDSSVSIRRYLNQGYESDDAYADEDIINLRIATPFVTDAVAKPKFVPSVDDVAGPSNPITSLNEVAGPFSQTNIKMDLPYAHPGLLPRPVDKKFTKMLQDLLTQMEDKGAPSLPEVEDIEH